MTSWSFTWQVDLVFDLQRFDEIVRRPTMRIVWLRVSSILLGVGSAWTVERLTLEKNRKLPRHRLWILPLRKMADVLEEDPLERSRKFLADAL